MHHLSAHVFGPIAQRFAAASLELQNTLNDINSRHAPTADDPSLIKLTQAYEFFSDAHRATGNTDIGLQAYAHAWPGCLGVPGYAIMSSPTLGAALERWVKYHPLATNGSTLHVRRHQHRLTITAVAGGVPFLQAPRAILDASVALIIGLIHWLVPDQKPVPIAVELPYPQPDDTRQLQRLFGPHLSFDRPHISLMFDDAITELALSTASPALEAIHCAHADALMSERLDGSLSAQIRRALAHDLARAKTATLQTLALSLGKSKRTLQHALEREGVTFSQLHDQCRKALAHDLLLSAGTSLKSIAIALGFRDASSFNKACQRWFGQSPGQLRAHEKAGG